MKHALLLLAVLAFAIPAFAQTAPAPAPTLATCPPACQIWKAGDAVIGATYGATSQMIDFNGSQRIVGLSGRYFLTDDFSLEGNLTAPRGFIQKDNVSASAQANYHFGALYIPLKVEYLRPGKDTAFATGIGLDFLAGPIDLRFQATGAYLMSDTPQGHALWDITALAGFKF